MTYSPGRRNPYELTLHEIQMGLGWLQRRFKTSDGRPAEEVALYFDGEDVKKVVQLLEAAEHGMATLEARTAEEVTRQRSRKRK